MKKYVIYDDYDMDMHCIGEYDSYYAYKKACWSYYDDTDGECRLYVSINGGEKEFLRTLPK